jgi:ATPase family AAA domain-containing protein 3A/B
MQSKLILSVLTLSLLPMQLCAFFGTSTSKVQHEHTVSPEFAKDMGETLKAVGTNMPELGKGFSKTMAETQLGFETMKTNLEKLGEGFLGVVKPVQDELIKGAVVFTAISITSIVMYEAAKKYIAKYLFEPSLIEKQSSHWITQSFSDALYGKKDVKLEDHMVISDKLSQDLNYIMKMTKNIKRNGGSFENVLLYGEPGTGKTLFAQLLAEHCGMAYAFVPAANVSKFLTKNTMSAAAHELDQLFAWAAGNSNGTILFFDEAETFLAQRSMLSIEAQNALAAFLAKTGTPSNKIMIICATNRPEIMDDAVLSRLGFRIEFPLPDLKARQAQLVMHVKKIFTKQTGNQISYTLLQDPASLAHIAQGLEGCSGRSIQKAVNRFRQTALAEDASAISQEIITRVIQQIQKDRVKPAVVVQPA